MLVELSFITGVILGFELHDDYEEQSTSLIVDCLIVRLVVTWWKQERTV